MKKIIVLALCLATTLFYNCEDSQDFETINFVSFENSSFDFGVEIQGSSTNAIRLYTSTITDADRQFNVEVDLDASTLDPNAYSVPTTAVVPSNTNVGMLSITISDLNISAEGESLVLKFQSEDGLFIGDPITLNVKQICPFPETILSIAFDAFPEEQSWELLDANDVQLFAGGPYPGETEFSQSFCLTSGTYTIIMSDSFGDGGGAYTISNNGTTILMSDGNYGFGEEQTFQVN